jgi:hypothetical protein
MSTPESALPQSFAMRPTTGVARMQAATVMQTAQETISHVGFLYDPTGQAFLMTAEEISVMPDGGPKTRLAIARPSLTENRFKITEADGRTSDIWVAEGDARPRTLDSLRPLARRLGEGALLGRHTVSLAKTLEDDKAPVNFQLVQTTLGDGEGKTVETLSLHLQRDFRPLEGDRVVTQSKRLEYNNADDTLKIGEATQVVCWEPNPSAGKEPDAPDRILIPDPDPDTTCHRANFMCHPWIEPDGPILDIFWVALITKTLQQHDRLRLQYS